MFAAVRMLGVISADYAAGGVGVLWVMVVASLFVGVNYVYFAIKRVQKDVKGIVVLNWVIFVSLVGLGYLFMTMLGLLGSGMHGWCPMGLGVCVRVCVGAMVWRAG